MSACTSLLMTVAGAFAVSSRLVPLSEVDTRLVGMTLTRNGELVDTGAGAAALGDPLAVVAWLANVLGDNGIALEPGHLVMTGAGVTSAWAGFSRSGASAVSRNRTGPCAGIACSGFTRAILFTFVSKLVGVEALTEQFGQ